MDQKRKISPLEYVQKYTEYLVRGYEQQYAIDRLLKVICPYKIFEESRTEQVLKKHCSQNLELQYPVSLLIEKLNDLPDFAFKDDFVKIQQSKMDNSDQKKTNQLFTDVLKAVRSETTPKTTTSRLDYSKFKIVKRSKSSSSLPTKPTGR
uniref:Uncharacterized protein n=1 Tax=Caenorhabditis tropicalis TaxID=1561998 RepID=A0A1I7V514_9PELO